MKREKVSSFLKSKGFYISLFAGIFAVFVLTMVYANVSSIRRQNEERQSEQQQLSERKQQSSEQLSESQDQSNEQNQLGQLAEVNPVGESAINGTVSKQEDTDVSLESDENEFAMSEPISEQTGPELESEFGEDLQQVEEITAAAEATETQEETISTPVASVSKQQNALQNLHFQEENGLLWPAEGQIIKHYSMDKLVYFQTLDQYKCNPAVLIGLEAGSEVLCGADGVVTAISESEELGNTLLVDIGNGYQLRYAQLQNLQVQVGDVVKEGALLAQVAEPTIYYAEEGSNLYFQVLQDGETVNPLLLLR